MYLLFGVCNWDAMSQTYHGYKCVVGIQRCWQICNNMCFIWDPFICTTVAKCFVYKSCSEHNIQICASTELQFQKNWKFMKQNYIPYTCHHNPLLTWNCSRILTIHKDRIFWKNLLENREMDFKNVVENIQTTGYDGRCMLLRFSDKFFDIINDDP